MEIILELFHWFIDVILHLDSHLVELLRDYGFWVYLILFAIVFAETSRMVNITAAEIAPAPCKVRPAITT